MKLSLAASYALHAVVHLAQQKKEGDKPIASRKIAEKQQISELFLLKVLKYLVTAEVLRSVKGPNGGYRLARPASDITMLEIVEAVEGPIRGLVPTSEQNAENGVHMRLEMICAQTAEATRKLLGKVKISELAGK